MVRITVNGEQVQFSSKLQIKPELWDTKNGKAIRKSAAAMNTNRLLEAISAKANELYHKHLSVYGYVLPEKIKNIILGIDSDRRKMLLEHFAEHNEFYVLKIVKDTSQITANRYKLTMLRLQEFLKAEYNRFGVGLCSFSIIGYTSHNRNETFVVFSGFTQIE